MESRQVRRARERREFKESKQAYPRRSQRGGATTSLIHKNRRHRGDGHDYFN